MTDLTPDEEAYFASLRGNPDAQQAFLRAEMAAFAAWRDRNTSVDAVTVPSRRPATRPLKNS